eukprot:18783-Heterococcus_DN1.PRE.2
MKQCVSQSQYCAGAWCNAHVHTSCNSFDELPCGAVDVSAHSQHARTLLLSATAPDCVQPAVAVQQQPVLSLQRCAQPLYASWTVHT